MAEIDMSMERIQKTICLVRGQKVMLDRDLAALYEVPTKVLKQAVKRHADRFPGVIGGHNTNYRQVNAINGIMSPN